MDKYDDDRLLEFLTEYDPLKELSEEEKKYLMAKFDRIFNDYDGDDDLNGFMNSEFLLEESSNNLTSLVQDALAESKDVLDYKERLVVILADAEEDLKEEGLVDEDSIGDY